MKSIQKRLSVILCFLILIGCAHQNQTVTDSTQSSTLETELGEAIHQRIIESLPVYQEENLNRYVHEVGQKLAAASDRKDLSYRFVILEDDRIHATHAPGGYVYITTGFFRFLESEIELAGVLVHEVGLLLYRDPRLSKLKKALEMLLQTGATIGPAFGSIGALSVLGLALVGGVVVPEKSLSVQIREADREALRYLLASGYDPQGLMNVLHRMSNPASPFRAYLYDYLESHPITPERMKKLDREFLKLPLENKRFEAHRGAYLTATEGVRSSFARN